MEFKSEQKFINELVLKENSTVQQAIFDYLEYAYGNGARECNDGYPDCRFSGAMRFSDTRARKLIAKFRKMYKYEQHIKYGSCNCTCENSKKSKPEVAQGFLSQIRYMLSKG